MDISFFWHGVPVDCEVEITDWDDGFDVGVQTVIVNGVDIMPILLNYDQALEDLGDIVYKIAESEFEQNDADARIDAIMEWKGYEH